MAEQAKHKILLVEDDQEDFVLYGELVRTLPSNQTYVVSTGEEVFSKMS